MNRKIYEVILLIWFLSSIYLLFGAIIFNKASSFGVALIIQSQIILLIIILLTATSIFPKNWEAKRWGLISFQIIGLNLICVLIRYIVEEIIFVRLGFPKSEPFNALFFVYDNFYYSLPGFFIGFITFLVFKTIAVEKRNSELRQAVQEAELNLLKSQINPHFLYNVLNYMYAVSLPLSERLSGTVAKLAGTMRYTLTKSDVQMVPLREEIEFIQDYIDLQSTQFDKGLHYCLHKELEDDSVMLPTLILIAFIENAFEHGVVDDPALPLIIAVRSTDKDLTLEVENHIQPKRKDPGNGIGLVNVQRRLEILYPDKHVLRTVCTDERFSVYLQLSL